MMKPIGTVSAEGVIVAAKNSRGMPTAQSVCDGTDDQVEIQAAVDTVASSGGGTVHLLDGTFTLSGPVRLVDGVDLIRQGENLTSLVLVNAGGGNLLENSSISDFETAGKTRISVLGSNVRLTNITVRNCVSIDNGQKKIQEKPRFGAGFLGGSPMMQFVDYTSERNSVGFRLSDGATAIRCRDTGSIQGFRTSGGNVTMIDCTSDQAQQWALYGLLSHNVIATNFSVTNPVGRPYPAILTGNGQYPSSNMSIQLASSAADLSRSSDAGLTDVFIDRAPSSTVTFSALLTTTSRLFTGPPSTIAAVSPVMGLRLGCDPSLGDRSPDRSVHQTL